MPESRAPPHVFRHHDRSGGAQDWAGAPDTETGSFAELDPSLDE